MSVRRTQPRQRSGGRKLARVVVAVAALALLVFAGSVLVRDVLVDRTLSHRGVAVTGTLVATDCHLCRAVGVDFTTTSGQKVAAVVSAIGPQADRTIHLRYDPQHPTTVHPAHGVREEEIIAGVLALLGLVVFLRCTGLPHRRGPRRGARIRTHNLSTQEAHGHVRLVGD